jgi:dTDP-4-amino-4,6-dideoxygalactose transaminase
LLFSRVHLFCRLVSSICCMTPEPIPFLSFSPQHDPIRQEVLEALAGVYDKNRFILGDSLRAFEEAYAAFCGTSWCVGVGNGYDALVIALKTCGIGKGDEIIVPAHTYVATWHAAAQTGAILRPVEPDPATFNIDPQQIEQHITPKTKAILPVHLYGQACNMTAIMALAHKHHLMVVEDNAQAHGATWAGQRTGSFGHANANSFYPTKNLGALGDGGAVTTSDETKAALARQFRNYGFVSKHVCADKGINSRLDEIQAAVLSVKLKYLMQWNEERRGLAKLYLETLRGVGDIILPTAPAEANHVYHLFVIRTAQRDPLKEVLAKEGIETMVHYPIPAHLQQAYVDDKFKKGDFPLTERTAETVLSVPLWPGMREKQVARISNVIRKFFQ